MKRKTWIYKTVSLILAMAFLLSEAPAAYAARTTETSAEESTEAAETGEEAAETDAETAETDGEAADAEAVETGEETSGTGDTTREEAISTIMETNPEDADEPVTVMPTLPDADYTKKFTYGDDLTMSGIFETQTLYFQVEDYWEVVYGYARIEFTLSQLIEGDVPASLTIMVNNTPVYTCKLDYEAGRTQTTYAEIPLELITEGYNTFDLTGYVRVYDDDGCIDDFSDANWVNISEDSYVEIGYGLKDANELISYYPYPFISSVEPDGAHTQVAVSDAVQEDELAAALLLRADLSAETDDESNITLTTVGEMKTKGVQTVLVSLWDNLPESYRALLTKEEQESDRMDSDALVKFVTTSAGDPLMLIVSKNADCLMEAAMMLVDDDRVTQENVSSTWVSENASEKIKEASSQSDLAAGRYTIEGIVGSGLSFVGPFHQESTVYLPFSGGYVLASSSKITLKFRYSENLDFDRSLITVYWGSVPVASKKLTKDNAGGDELTFTMPTDVVGTSATSLVVAFDLELPELFCTPRMDEMPWAYVTGDSSLYLPLGVNGERSFSLRPFPFEESSMFNDLLVVIPDTPSAAELDTLGQVISAWGESITSYGNIAVRRAGNFTEEDANYNIIVIGSYEDNSLIRTLNTELAFPYNENGTIFLGNEKLVLSENYADRIGILQLIESPYGEERSMLIVGGLDDKTISQLGEFLSKSDNLWKLEGDTALIDDEGEIKTFTFAENESTETPTLKEFYEQNEEDILFTVAATSAMLLLLFACLLLLLRTYGRNKSKKS